MKSKTEILQVELGERSYPIYIGRGVLQDPALYRRHVPGEQLLVVTNETVGPLYLEQLQQALQGFKVEVVVLPDGEQFKTLEVWQGIFDTLLKGQYNRQCTILALGGGVVGDIAGFSAACYQRGVNFIQIPTTLLAQVDSSVGGKTGVNHPGGKNMIGAFYQPRCVIADTATLDTLDGRQLAAGIAEIIKYGLINDAEFFSWLEQNIDGLLSRDAAALAFAIERSCRNKAELVAADEREAGQRALLNLGHTFGHAIEAAVGYGNWLHGEAVAAGICMAARLSNRLGWLTDEDEQRTVKLVKRAGLPVAPPSSLQRDECLELMAIDKKVMDGRIRLVLLKGIGRAIVTAEFDLSELHKTLDEY
jgi:3-dehydroquinate synthase